MSVGFIMLVHTALDRAGSVARHWADSGCPVVIHVDQQVSEKAYLSFAAGLADLPNVMFCMRQKVEWGTFSLVDATIAASQLLLRNFPDVGHVYLASGSCLPLRPVQELESYLEQHSGTDFIESVTTYDIPWTVGGLDFERFTLRFPFSWRRQRKLFDRYVQLQRRVGYKRKIPDEIVPHLGSQWWCLTRETLDKILNNPKAALYNGYFRRVWIPDESYFQSLVRLFSTKIESRSLTLSKFDFQGRPHVFYDDHIQLLRRSDCFVARKIWPHADRLYASFLSNDPAVTKNAEPSPEKIDRLFSEAVARRTRGRAGLNMHSGFQMDKNTGAQTCAPYSVFEGFSELFENYEQWLSRAVVGRVHGHLFHPQKARFAGGQDCYNGSLSSNAKLRDYNADAFLTNLIWNTRGEHQCFQFGPRDVQKVSDFLAQDANAQISVITGAWAISLFRLRKPISKISEMAAELQKTEMRHLAVLQRANAKARIRVWTLSEFLQTPMENLQLIVDDISSGRRRRLTEAPKMKNLTGFGTFLQDMRNQGLQLHLAGDFALTEASAHPAEMAADVRSIGGPV